MLNGCHIAIDKTIGRVSFFFRGIDYFILWFEAVQYQMCTAKLHQILLQEVI